MKKYRNYLETFLFIINSLILCFTMNCFVLMQKYLWLIPIVLLLFVGANALPFYSKQELPNKRFKICAHGNRCLKSFVITLIFTVIYHVVMAFVLIPDKWEMWVVSVVVAFITNAILFWNGILSVYFTSCFASFTGKTKMFSFL